MIVCIALTARITVLTCESTIITSLDIRPTITGLFMLSKLLQTFWPVSLCYDETMLQIVQINNGDHQIEHSVIGLDVFLNCRTVSLKVEIKKEEYPEFLLKYYHLCDLMWRRQTINLDCVHAGLPDPFAKVVVDGSGQCHSTDTVKSTLDPKWNQHYDLWVSCTTTYTLNTFLKMWLFNKWFLTYFIVLFLKGSNKAVYLLFYPICSLSINGCCKRRDCPTIRGILYLI